MDVDIHDPPAPPQINNTRRVAAGEIECCLTGVTHFLMAQDRDPGRLPARFVAVIHQRSPVTVVVPEASHIQTPEDLGGCRMPRSPAEATGWVTRECLAAVAELDIEPPVTVAMDADEVGAALREGRVDAAATFADVVPHLRSSAGIDVRAMAVGTEVYATGLVANDGVSDEVVRRLRGALARAFEHQREDPGFGVQQMCSRFDNIDPAQVREGWQILQPYAFAAGTVGQMNKQRWDATTGWLSDVHGLSPDVATWVYRPTFATDRAADPLASA